MLREKIAGATIKWANIAGGCIIGARGRGASFA